MKKRDILPTDADIASGFENFVAEPANKMLISTVPPAENPDTFRTLLMAAYRTGAMMGSAHTGIQFLLMSFEPRE